MQQLGKAFGFGFLLAGAVLLSACRRAEAPTFGDMQTDCRKLVSLVVDFREVFPGVLSLAYEGSGEIKHGKDAIALFLLGKKNGYEYRIEFLSAGQLSAKSFRGDRYGRAINYREDLSCLWSENGDLERAISNREGKYARDRDRYPMTRYSSYPEITEGEAIYRCDRFMRSVAQTCRTSLRSRFFK